MADLTTIFHHLQRQLFHALTAELGPLSALDQQFCEVMALTDLGRFTRRYAWRGNGWATSQSLIPTHVAGKTPICPGPGATLQGTQRQ